MSETVDDEKRLEEALAEQRPLYLIGLHAFLTVFFIIYDALVYIPFKLFADPEKKREISDRVKVGHFIEVLDLFCYF